MKSIRREDVETEGPRDATATECADTLAACARILEASPEVVDLPFSLTAPSTKLARGNQPSLF